MFVWISGRPTCGKTFLGDYLERHHGFVHIDGDTASHRGDRVWEGMTKCLRPWFEQNADGRSKSHNAESDSAGNFRSEAEVTEADADKSNRPCVQPQLQPQPPTGPPDTPPDTCVSPPDPTLWKPFYKDLCDQAFDVLREKREHIQKGDMTGKDFPKVVVTVLILDKAVRAFILEEVRNFWHENSHENNSPENLPNYTNSKTPLRFLYLHLSLSDAAHVDRQLGRALRGLQNEIEESDIADVAKQLKICVGEPGCAHHLSCQVRNRLTN